MPATFPFRIGHGYDLHRLQPGGKLTLAGVVVSHEISPVAHSDGDVVLHALVDAILGATGGGDIGERFANTDSRWKNAPSRTFVETVWSEATAAGWTLCNADVMILAERPKLAPFKAEMAATVSALLGGGPVSIKAGTNEGCGEIGRGEAVAAHAVVLLGRA